MDSSSSSSQRNISNVDDDDNNNDDDKARSPLLTDQDMAEIATAIDPLLSIASDNDDDNDADDAFNDDDDEDHQWMNEHVVENESGATSLKRNQPLHRTSDSSSSRSSSSSISSVESDSGWSDTSSHSDSDDHGQGTVPEEKTKPMETPPTKEDDVTMSIIQKIILARRRSLTSSYGEESTFQQSTLDAHDHQEPDYDNDDDHHDITSTDNAHRTGDEDDIPLLTGTDHTTTSSSRHTKQSKITQEDPPPPSHSPTRPTPKTEGSSSSSDMSPRQPMRRWDSEENMAAIRGGSSSSGSGEEESSSGSNSNSPPSPPKPTELESDHATDDVPIKGKSLTPLLMSLADEEPTEQSMTTFSDEHLAENLLAGNDSKQEETRIDIHNSSQVQLPVPGSTDSLLVVKGRDHGYDEESQSGTMQWKQPRLLRFCVLCSCLIFVGAMGILVGALIWSNSNNNNNLPEEATASPTAFTTVPSSMPGKATKQPTLTPIPPPTAYTTPIPSTVTTTAPSLPNTQELPTSAPSTGESSTITSSPTVIRSTGLNAQVPVTPILSVLDAVSSDGGAAIRRFGSPQNQAYLWLLNQNNDGAAANMILFRTEAVDVDKTNIDLQRIVQRYVMATLYYATNGLFWNQQHQWMNASLDECFWSQPSNQSVFTPNEENKVEGSNSSGTSSIVVNVDCKADGTLLGNNDDDANNSVTTLEFHNNNLLGNLPPELGLLTRLRHLVIRDATSASAERKLTGAIPSEVGLITNLETLILNGNSFTLSLESNITNSSHHSNIPSEIGLLQAIQVLNLNDNNMTGALPDAIGSLSTLQRLDLGSNAFTGSIPVSWQQLTALEDLALAHNRLMGELPVPFLEGISKNLTSLALGHNVLSGSLPTEIGLLTGIRNGLGLQHNQFSGELPTEIGNLSNMTHFQVQHNRLSGELPQTFQALTLLLVFQIHANEFSGSVPEAVCETLDRTREEAPWLAVSSADCPHEIECSCCRLCCTDEGGCQLSNNNSTGAGDEIGFMLFRHEDDNLVEP